MADDRSATTTISDDTFTVLGGEYDGIDPGDVMLRYIRRQSASAIERLGDEFEDRTTSEQIESYQRQRRQQFIDSIGGLPERTPLNSTVVNEISCDGYRVESVLFESQSDHHVTGTLYLPDSAEYDPPYPGVVVCCGHSNEAKAYDLYSRVGALMARNGLAGLVFDPICQGERYQLYEDGELREGASTRGHGLLAYATTPLGRNVARFMIHDAMRTVDYLQSREDIDGEKIGATGISGGGTQSAYLGALDDRVVATAPGCWITSIEALLEERIAEDAEQNIHGQLSFCLDHADLLMMRAPSPTLVLAATDDFFDIEGTWDSVRTAKRFYGRLGYPERIEIAEVEDGHGFTQLLREAAVAWMARWLRDENINVTEPPDLEILDEEAIQCTPTGQVIRMDDERTVYDLNEEYADTLAEEREQRWESDPVGTLEDVREIVGVRPLAELPEPAVDRVDVTQHDGYEIERLVFEVEEGVPLPAVRFTPDEPSGSPVLCLHEDGKRAAVAVADLDSLLADGRDVLAVDLRSTGETSPAEKYFVEVYAAYRLGLSYVGMRTEDILTVTRWFRDRSQADSVRLRATGDAGVPALHAAALEPDAFEDLRLSETLHSWTSIIREPGSKTSLENIIHGTLPVYDLPDLAAYLDDTVTVENVRMPA